MNKQVLPSGVANVRGDVVYFQIPRRVAVKGYCVAPDQIVYEAEDVITYIPEFLDPMSIRLMNGKVVECVNNEGFDITKDIKWADAYETWQSLAMHFYTLCRRREIFKNSPLIPYLSINDETEYVNEKEVIYGLTRED